MIKSIISNVLLSTEGTQNENFEGSDIVLYVIIGVVAVAVIAMLVFTNISRKKQAKKKEEMLDSLAPGDIIETAGGIIGTIVSTRNSSVGKEFIIETGEEGRKTTLTVDVQALYCVIYQKNPPRSAASDGKSNKEVVHADVNKPDDGTMSNSKKDK